MNNFKKCIFIWIDHGFLSRVNFENQCRARGITSFPDDFRFDEENRIVSINCDGSLRYVNQFDMYFLLRAEEAVVVSHDELESMFDALKYKKLGEPEIIRQKDIIKLHMTPGFNEESLKTRNFLKYIK